MRDCAVITRSEPEPHLVAYVVPSPEAGASLLIELREQLGAALPSYLVPEEWVSIPELPTGPGGKIDLHRLPPPAGAEPRHEPPTTPAERRLHDIWREELRVPAIPRNGSFFGYGGNSLTAVRVLSRIREKFGVQLSLAGFINDPTISGLARMLQA